MKHRTNVNTSGWIIAGVITAVSGVLSPLHELGHMLLGARWEDWTTTSWAPGTITVEGIFAGYGLEFAVVAATEVAATTWMRFLESGTRLRAWAIGYLPCLVVIASLSHDFNVAILKTPASPADIIILWAMISAPWTAFRAFAFLNEYYYTNKE
jgi:hypothetical protein